MIQTSKLQKSSNRRQEKVEKSSTISKRIKKSVPDKYSKDGAGVFQLFVQSGRFYLIVRPKLKTIANFFFEGGGGVGLNRENCIDFEVFMTMEAIHREVIFFCRNKWIAIF